MAGGGRLLGHLQIALEHGERGAQLVGDVGNKVLAGLLQAAQPGHVPHHQHGLILGIGHDAKLEKLLLVDGGAHLERLIILPLAEVGDETGVTDEVADVLAGILGPAKTEQLLRQPVAPENAAVGAKHHGGIGQGLGPLPKPADETRQLAAPCTVALLQLVDAIEDVFPTAAAMGRHQAAIVPQPVRQPLLEAVVPAQMQHGRHQQTEGEVFYQPTYQDEGGVEERHSPQLSPPGVRLQHVIP